MLASYFQDQLTRLYFHLVRKRSEIDLQTLAREVSHIFVLLKSSTSTEHQEYIDLFFRLILHTRNIQSYGTFTGKGEHDLTYMLLSISYLYFPEETLQLTYLCFTTYGSWRDMKYLCDYLRRYTSPVDPSMYSFYIQNLIQFTNQQLKQDYDTWRFSTHCRSRDHITSLYKWIPREHKQFDWLHEQLAYQWSNQHYSYIYKTIPNDDSRRKALNKAKKKYRKVYARLSKEVSASAVTPSLVQAAHDFSLASFVKKVFMGGDDLDKASIQEEWNRYSKTISSAGFHSYVLPMVDVSVKMQEYDAVPFYTAIGFALLIAERNCNRIMLYGVEPAWVETSPSDVVATIQTIKESIFSIGNMTSSPIKAVQLMEESILATLSQDVVTLVFFSTSFFTLPRSSFSRIVYWNLSPEFVSMELPVSYNAPTFALLSGLCGSLLSAFSIIEKYDDVEMTPYLVVKDILMQPGFSLQLTVSQ